MRRLALVASAACGAAARGAGRDPAVARRAAEPAASACYGRLADVPLEQSDVLWMRGAAERGSAPARVAPGGWPGAGDPRRRPCSPRALGLALDPPAASPLPHSSLRGFGLAGFGPHPLFAGLRDGAVLAPTFDGGPPALTCCYGRAPAAEGAVVAVRRAWARARPRHCPCLGVRGRGRRPAVPGLPPLAADGRRLDSASRCRSGPGQRARGRRDSASRARDACRDCGRRPDSGRRAPSQPSRSSSAPTDDWPASAAAALDLAPAAEWTHAGRRLLVRARARAGARSGRRRSGSCTTPESATRSPARRGT